MGLNTSTVSGDWFRTRVAVTVVAVLVGPFFIPSMDYEELSWFHVGIVLGGFCLLLPVVLLLYLWLQSKTYGFCRIRRPSWHNSPLDRHYPLDSLHFFAVLLLAAGIGGNGLILIYGFKVLPYSCFIAAPGAAMWFSVWLVYAMKCEAGIKPD